MTIIACRCNWCKRTHYVEMTQDQLNRYEAWLNNPQLHIQDCLPDLSEEERELLVSGSCSCREQWDDIFGFGEEERIYG
jgi:hypothetical protein